MSTPLDGSPPCSLHPAPCTLLPGHSAHIMKHTGSTGLCSLDAMHAPHTEHTLVSSEPQPTELPCRTLGIESGASAAEVKKAHRRLMVELHPDTFIGDEEGAEAAKERMLEVHEAYAELGGGTGGSSVPSDGFEPLHSIVLGTIGQRSGRCMLKTLGGALAPRQDCLCARGEVPGMTHGSGSACARACRDPFMSRLEARHVWTSQGR